MHGCEDVSTLHQPKNDLGPLLLKSSEVWAWFYSKNFSRPTFFVFLGTHLVDTFLNNMPVKQIWRKSAVCIRAKAFYDYVWIRPWKWLRTKVSRQSKLRTKPAGVQMEGTNMNGSNGMSMWNTAESIVASAKAAVSSKSAGLSVRI